MKAILQYTSATNVDKQINQINMVIEFVLKTIETMPTFQKQFWRQTDCERVPGSDVIDLQSVLFYYSI